VDRRQFIESAIGAAGLAVVGSQMPFAAGTKGIPKPTDLVEIGKTGVKVTRVAMGTGTVGGRKSSNQTRLGQEKFTAIAREALESGITFFDSADLYGSMPLFGRALKGVPRRKFVYLSKLWGNDGKQAEKDFQRFLKELRTDYIDICLTHCATTTDWAKQREGVLEFLSKAKKKGMIRAHGVSWHGAAPLKTIADTEWGDFALVRINHKGVKMDGSPDEVVPHIEKIKKSGKFVMAMKVLGEGQLADERDESLRFTLGLGMLDAMTIGFEKPAQIDDLLGRWQSAMNEVARKAVKKAA
jgi:predicted aldo/keto reductase-like oxidoreductase